MTKEEKIELVKELTEKFKTYPNLYIADTGGMTVAESNELRKVCFEKDIQLQMIKNTLIQKALENLEGDFSEVYPSLKKTSSVFFATEENPNVPAKIIKDFRKGPGKDKELPILKAAIIETSVFTGDDQLDALTNLKSKNELIGEVITILQSPAKNVIGALQSGGQTIAGLIKTLQEREEV